MTLRLEDELDARVTALAADKRMSKQQLIVRAVEKYLAEDGRADYVRSLARDAAARYPETLRRLGE